MHDIKNNIVISNLRTLVPRYYIFRSFNRATLPRPCFLEHLVFLPTVTLTIAQLSSGGIKEGIEEDLLIQN